MSFVRENSLIPRRGYTVLLAVWYRLSITAPLRQPVRILAVAMVTILILVAGFLMLPSAATVQAASEPNPPQECLSCHPKTLEFHDKLGSGNSACSACHDNADMKTLRLADGSGIPLADSAQLCGQCHQARFAAWEEGTHGIAGTVAAVTCTSCHDPHQPKMTFPNITLPHPEPAPPPPSPPVNLVIIFGVSLAIMITVGVIGTRRGEGP